MTTSRQLEQWKQWFNGYYRSFLTDEKDYCDIIQLKYDHTVRVCGEILALGGSLGLSGDDLATAEAIALFHDLGRFVQYQRFRTFSDARSVNHAELSESIVRDHSLLDDIDDSTGELILKAIRYHNAIKIPPVGRLEIRFFCEMLRDADKLDIYRIAIESYRAGGGAVRLPVNLELPDTGILSPEVESSIMGRRPVPNQHIKSITDFKFLQIGWIFDVVFDTTINEINRRGYLDTLFGTLPDTERIRRLRSIVMNTIREKMDRRLSALPVKVSP